MGDQLLSQVASRLLACVREADTVARFGGDEFVVMLENLSSHLHEAASQAEAVADKLLASLNQPFELGGAALQHAQHWHHLCLGSIASRWTNCSNGPTWRCTRPKLRAATPSASLTGNAGGGECPLEPGG